MRGPWSSGRVYFGCPACIALVMFIVSACGDNEDLPSMIATQSSELTLVPLGTTKFMSWNLHEDAQDGFSGPRARITHGIRYVVASQYPDVIALQEVQMASHAWDQTEMIRHVLDELNYYIPSRWYKLAYFVRNNHASSFLGLRDSKSGMALIYDAYRYSVDLNAGYRECLNDPPDFSLATAREGPTWCINRRGAEASKHIIMAGVRLIENTTGASMNVYNVHPSADHASMHNNLIFAKIRDIEDSNPAGAPPIALGDFNAVHSEMLLLFPYPWPLIPLEYAPCAHPAEDIDHILIGRRNKSAYRYALEGAAYFRETPPLHSDHRIVSLQISVFRKQ